MLFQEFLADLAEPVVESGWPDSVDTHVFDGCQAARPAVDDDLFPMGELLLVHGFGEMAQNKNLPASGVEIVAEVVQVLKLCKLASSDYLTKSGREVVGGLLGAYDSSNDNKAAASHIR